ncbi:MAG TPA: response regulator [Urbifossiella sp.]|nr:response regulator [Urbifossiella sp.]
MDDDADAAGAIARHLTAGGAQVLVCLGSEAAVAAWSSFRPHAMLVEPHLPGMDGFALARWVRQQSGGTRALLTAVSVLGGREAVWQAVAAGYDVHLGKPADPKAMIALVAGFCFKLRLDSGLAAF